MGINEKLQNLKKETIENFGNDTDEKTFNTTLPGVLENAFARPAILDTSSFQNEFNEVPPVQLGSQSQVQLASSAVDFNATGKLNPTVLSGKEGGESTSNKKCEHNYSALPSPSGGGANSQYRRGNSMLRPNRIAAETSSSFKRKRTTCQTSQFSLDEGMSNFGSQPTNTSVAQDVSSMSQVSQVGGFPSAHLVINSSDKSIFLPRQIPTPPRDGSVSMGTKQKIRKEEREICDVSSRFISCNGMDTMQENITKHENPKNRATHCDYAQIEKYTRDLQKLYYQGLQRRHEHQCKENECLADDSTVVRNNKSRRPSEFNARTTNNSMPDSEKRESDFDFGTTSILDDFDDVADYAISSGCCCSYIASSSTQSGNTRIDIAATESFYSALSIVNVKDAMGPSDVSILPQTDEITKDKTTFNDINQESNGSRKVTVQDGEIKHPFAGQHLRSTHQSVSNVINTYQHGEGSHLQICSRKKSPSLKKESMVKFNSVENTRKWDCRNTDTDRTATTAGNSSSESSFSEEPNTEATVDSLLSRDESKVNHNAESNSNKS